MDGTHSFKQQNHHSFFPSNFCQKNADDFHVFRLDFSFTSQLFFESFHCQTLLFPSTARINPHTLDLESSLPGQVVGDLNKIPWCSSQHVPCVSLNKHRHVNMKNNIKTLWINSYLFMCHHVTFQHISWNFHIYSLELQKAQTWPVTSTIDHKIISLSSKTSTNCP